MCYLCVWQLVWHLCQPKEKKEISTDFMTSKATSELLNCCAMRLNKSSSLFIPSMSADVWCVNALLNSNSLIEHCTAAISYMQFSAFSSLELFFVLNLVTCEHIMGNFVLFFNCQKIKGLMMRPRGITETQSDIKIRLLRPRMLFQVLQQAGGIKSCSERPVSSPEDE